MSDPNSVEPAELITSGAVSADPATGEPGADGKAEGEGAGYHGPRHGGSGAAAEASQGRSPRRQAPPIAVRRARDLRSHSYRFVRFVRHAAPSLALAR
jgi:hypothetical protein